MTDREHVAGTAVGVEPRDSAAPADGAARGGWDGARGEDARLVVLGEVAVRVAICGVLVFDGVVAVAVAAAAGVLAVLADGTGRVGGGALAWSEGAGEGTAMDGAAAGGCGAGCWAEDGGVVRGEVVEGDCLAGRVRVSVSGVLNKIIGCDG